jgi:hypothetical protein
LNATIIFDEHKRRGWNLKIGRGRDPAVILSPGKQLPSMNDRSALVRSIASPAATCR